MRMSSLEAQGTSLCVRCRHARRVETPRSSFILCEMSRHDASYVRYPQQPLLACRGFEGAARPAPESSFPVDDGPGKK
jgi:hypothetical protein